MNNENTEQEEDLGGQEVDDLHRHIELLVDAEECIGFLEDDMEALVAVAAKLKAVLLTNDRASLGQQGCVTLDAQLAVLAEVFGNDL